MSQLHAVVNMLGPLLVYILKNKIKTLFGSLKMLNFFFIPSIRQLKSFVHKFWLKFTIFYIFQQINKIYLLE